MGKEFASSIRGALQSDRFFVLDPSFLHKNLGKSRKTPSKPLSKTHPVLSPHGCDNLLQTFAHFVPQSLTLESYEAV
jgi:hypothetical protein